MAKNETTKTDAQLVKDVERTAKAFAKAFDAAREAGLECQSFRADDIVHELNQDGLDFTREFEIAPFKPSSGDDDLNAGIF
jgi:hypothetical protein